MKRILAIALVLGMVPTLASARPYFGVRPVLRPFPFRPVVEAPLRLAPPVFCSAPYWVHPVHRPWRHVEYRRDGFYR